MRPVNHNDVLATVSTVMRVAAMALALVALAKLFGFVQARGSVLDLAAVAVALALSK